MGGLLGYLYAFSMPSQVDLEISSGQVKVAYIIHFEQKLRILHMMYHRFKPRPVK